MFCGKCGAKVNDDASYCPRCGEPLKKDKIPGTARPGIIIDPIPSWHYITKVVIAICLVLIMLIPLIFSSKDSCYTQLLGDWYAKGGTALHPPYIKTRAVL